MITEEQVEVKNIGHLGIVASIFKKHRIVEKIDELLPKTSNNQRISHGEAVLAMVLQGLGISSNRLYLSTDFFSNVAVARLFRPDIKPEYFNATALSRTLDAIFEYGPAKFFMDCTLGVVLDRKLLGKFFHIDTSSFCVTGSKYKGDGTIELKQGYSKDHRFDLKQLVLTLVANEEGIPVYSETHSGNTADCTLFQAVIENLQESLDCVGKERFFVLDASIYNKEFLKNSSILAYWIARVPESIKDCREAVETDYPDALWTKVDDDFKYIELESNYGNRNQRWLLVRNRESKYKELATFKKRLDKEEDAIKKSRDKLEKRLFADKAEIRCAVDSLRKQHPNFVFTVTEKRKTKRVKGSKKRIGIGYTALISVGRNEDRIKKKKLRKGRFIIATDCTNDEELSSSEMLAAYRSRNRSVEGCFKFLKGKDLNLNQIFFKKESRIEAMMAVLTLILFANNLAQHTLRESLETNNTSIPSRLGSPCKKPTFKWASHLMQHISLVRIKLSDRISELVKNINKTNETIIRAFGSDAVSIYGL